MLQKLGDEFSILREIPPEEIGRIAGPCVEEGIRRLRAGQVGRIPGYDGEYGVIQLLDEEEISRFSGQISLFPAELFPKKTKSGTKKSAIQKEGTQPVDAKRYSAAPVVLRPECRTAGCRNLRGERHGGHRGTGHRKNEGLGFPHRFPDRKPGCKTREKLLPSHSQTEPPENCGSA